MSDDRFINKCDETFTARIASYAGDNFQRDTAISERINECKSRGEDFTFTFNCVENLCHLWRELTMDDFIANPFR